MDLEFYWADMPLEAGIRHFPRPEILAKGRGCSAWGPPSELSMETCAGRIRGSAGCLRGLQRRPHFHNDGNFQFKNKFRPMNTRLYVSRSRDAPSASFTDVLMIFADPETGRQSRRRRAERARNHDAGSPGAAAVLEPWLQHDKEEARRGGASLHGAVTSNRAVYRGGDGLLADHVITGRSISARCQHVDLAASLRRRRGSCRAWPSRMCLNLAGRAWRGRTPGVEVKWGQSSGFTIHDGRIYCASVDRRNARPCQGKRPGVRR